MNMPQLLFILFLVFLFFELLHLKRLRHFRFDEKKFMCSSYFPINQNSLSSHSNTFSKASILFQVPIGFQIRNTQCLLQNSLMFFPFFVCLDLQFVLVYSCKQSHGFLLTNFVRLPFPIYQRIGHAFSDHVLCCCSPA